MNTTTTYQNLQPGQALLLERLPSSLVLVEGEVLVQAPAQWLGDALVQPRAVRVVAPQALSVDDGSSIVASKRAKLAVENQPRTLSIFGHAFAWAQPA